MPGLRKAALVRIVMEALKAAECGAKGAGLKHVELPYRLTVTFPSKATRQFNLYCWTVGHGGRTRAQSEYRIQAMLGETRRLKFTGGTTVLLGYYHSELDRVGASLGNVAPTDMRLFVAWDPVRHLKVGASSSCQVAFPLLREAHLAGAAVAARQSQFGLENVFAFRPEFLARYLHQVCDGHDNVSLDTLTSARL